MKTLEIELPDEMVRPFEEKAAARNIDLQTWLREQLEMIASVEEGTAWEEEKLLEALDSPMIEATPEWWAQFEKETLSLLDNEQPK